MDREAATKTLEAHLSSHPDVSIRIAWRTLKPLIERVSRTSQALSTVGSMAMRAVKVREALDLLVPALPPTLFQVAADARVDITAVIEAFKTGAPNDPPPLD